MNDEEEAIIWGHSTLYVWVEDLNGVDCVCDSGDCNFIYDLDWIWIYDER
jgi:hypothetical protein